MILYDAVHAPSPRRVRMVVAEKGITLERRLVDLRGGEHLGEAFRRINPRATVPVLVADDVVLTDSVAICRYLDHLVPEPPLFGRFDAEVALVEQWCRQIDELAYRSAVDALRNRASAFAERALPGLDVAIPQIPALIERARIVFASFACELNARLGESIWIAGATYSFADITGLVAIDFAERAGLPVAADLEHLARWRGAMNDRSGAQA